MRELKIGIYGGTFDPPHIGHIAAAKAAMETLALDRLLLVPTFIPPHKALPAGAASPAQRRDMAVLATATMPPLRPDGALRAPLLVHSVSDEVFM